MPDSDGALRQDWKLQDARLLCALMLTLQFCVPLFPTWGAFVPHDHWSNERITQTLWAAHLQEHRAASGGVCVVLGEALGTRIFSTLAQDGLSSFEALLGSHVLYPSTLNLPHVFGWKMPAHDFTVRYVSYAPPDPPPMD